MAGGALYGIFLAAVMLILTTVLPPALGWTIFWSAVAIQLALGAVLVWRRTALPAMTAAYAWGAGAAVVFAFLAAKGVLLQESWERAPMATFAAILVAPLVMFAERWLHPAQWQSLGRAVERATLLDVLAFRHIPDLRTAGRQR